MERVALPSLRGSSRRRSRTRVSYVSCIASRVLYHQRHRGSPQSACHRSPVPHLSELPHQCSACQATRSLSTSASQHWVPASFPGWAAQTGRPFWGHGCHSTKGGRSFLPAQTGQAVWGCPRPPGGGVGKPLGRQSILKPGSVQAPRQLAVGPSRLWVSGSRAACHSLARYPCQRWDALRLPAACQRH